MAMNKMSFFRIIKSQKGFTLMELLAVLVVTGILMVLISVIYTNIVQSNINATVTNEVRASGQTMMERIARSLRQANSVSPGVQDCSRGPCYTLSLTISDNTGAHTYFFGCTAATPPVPSLFIDQTSSPMNNGNTLVNLTNCGVVPPAPSGSLSNIDPAQSNFEILPQAGSQPQRVIINLVLSTLSPSNHTEYGTRQTLTQMVEVRNSVN
jgi:prepilin-type N-terminal cleavage/methylation domain-containing protein